MDAAKDEYVGATYGKLPTPTPTNGRSGWENIIRNAASQISHLPSQVSSLWYSERVAYLSEMVPPSAGTTYIVPANTKPNKQYVTRRPFIERLEAAGIQEISKGVARSATSAARDSVASTPKQKGKASTYLVTEKRLLSM